MKKNKEQLITRNVHTAAALHVREAGEGEAASRTITGYAILFNNESAPLWEDEEEVAVEVISPSAITKELLDVQDIKMTMFHDRQLILARSKNGAGTLTYTVDEKGVAFSFDAPNTVDGDKALELVRRGDIAGCSFAFRTHYYDAGCVSRNAEVVAGKTKITYSVNVVTGVYDFTLAADPAYPDTNCEAERELREAEHEDEAKTEAKKREISEQVREMRCAASKSIDL